MKFVSMFGALDHFDKFVSTYIINSNLHPENAQNVITLVHGIKPFPDTESKGDQLMGTCTALLESIDLKRSPEAMDAFAHRQLVPLDLIGARLTEIGGYIQRNREEYDAAVERLRASLLIRESLENIISLNVNVEQFFSLEFVKFRFGKMPKESLAQLGLLADALEIIIVPLSTDDRYCWMIYFTPSSGSEKVDGVVSSMQFERTRLSSELSGTPHDAMDSINGTISELEARIGELRAESEAYIEQHGDELLHIYYSLARINRNHEVRRNAVCTDNSFYICGWIPEEDLPGLASAIELEESDMYVEEDPSRVQGIKPPTELKNPPFFKFFEILIKMYGLPAYDEIDPTAFVAVTYFLMFGIMFGDAGQGLIIMLIGLALMRRKFSLAGVFACAGASSIIFGLIYGSLFGDEEILPELYGRLFGTGAPVHLIRPMEDTMTLLIGGVVIGVLFMLAAVALNIVNGLREKNLARVLFDRNGAAGTLLYWTILLTAVFYAVAGSSLIPAALVAALVAVTFLALFFKEPLERLLVERKSFLPKEKGLFFVQGLFEMVETLLSMASNTLSFIRVGAFALNHVGLFMAFNILSKMAGNVGGVFIQLFANALIIGLEGLIVGIQCLRLEYYELFSKFFKGDGKPYRPLSRSIL
ncbi:MAG: hypothetical protein FWH01_05480 [Oscillospiraceae bacterium]|nr:hypothetical protein [Oscillospiraceae bacterium]